MIKLYKNKILAWILHNANSNPVFIYKKEFYKIKDIILKKHGYDTGLHDLQHIQKECWTCDDGVYPYPSQWGSVCMKCGGTGLYTDFWVKLNIWQFGKYEFHMPEQRLFRTSLAKIYIRHKFPKEKGRKIIDDYIHHKRMVWSTDCNLILFLFYNPKLFWRAIGKCGFSRKTPIALLFNCFFKLNPKRFLFKIKYRIYRLWRRLYWEIKHHKNPDAWNPYYDEQIPF